uniref:Uncharacterized protein n=1 Tax=Romanomermis culicivorax TaxID=13658 RepID=A0A915I777_ROMCU
MTYADLPVNFEFLKKSRNKYGSLEALYEADVSSENDGEENIQPPALSENENPAFENATNNQTLLESSHYLLANDEVEGTRSPRDPELDYL